MGEGEGEGRGRGGNRESYVLAGLFGLVFLGLLFVQVLLLLL